MGKYTGQAGSYSKGIRMVNTTLTNVLEELKRININTTNEDLDYLGEKTIESIKLITESIESLIVDISSSDKKIMDKAIALDKEIEKRLARKEAQIENDKINGTTTRVRAKNILEDRKMII